MIWKKRKKVILDCFTFDENVYKNYPIQHLRNARPKWYKNLPNYNNTQNLNMKFCPGIVEQYRNGFFSPLSCDIEIDVKNNSCDVTTNNDSIKFTSHEKNQYKNFLKNTDNYQHLKIISPWLIKTKKEKKFFLSPAFWNGVGIDDLKEINITPGITGFSFSRAYNPLMFIDMEKNKKISLKKNQILCHFIPLFEEKLVIKNHLVSEKEWSEIKNSSEVNLFFKKTYYRAKKLNDSIKK